MILVNGSPPLWTRPTLMVSDGTTSATLFAADW